FLFFFSSRRRHTRFSRDWSSDVCSSDLASGDTDVARIMARGGGASGRPAQAREGAFRSDLVAIAVGVVRGLGLAGHPFDRFERQIGRASCRERAWMRVVGGTALSK